MSTIYQAPKNYIWVMQYLGIIADYQVKWRSYHNGVYTKKTKRVSIFIAIDSNNFNKYVVPDIKDANKAERIIIADLCEVD